MVICLFTIKDLAEASGYTVTTVSRAMNDSPLVAEKTKEKIKKIAREHGYFPSAIARNLVSGNTSTACVIVPDIVNPYFPVIIKAAQDVLQDAGYFTIVCNSNWHAETEFSLVRLMVEQRVGGLIMDPSSDQTYEHIKHANIKVPIVFVGNRTSDDEVPSILVDNHAAMRLAVQYLTQLGHKKIVLIGGQENTYINRIRKQGFCDTMKEDTGISGENMVFPCTYQSKDGYQAMTQLLNSGYVPTAVITVNDTIAFGVLACLKDRGLEVPGDISVIGFDDVEMSAQVGLTTVREPRYEMGKTAAKILIEKMEQPDLESGAAKHILFEPKLVVRSSCSTPRK